MKKRWINTNGFVMKNSYQENLNKIHVVFETAQIVLPFSWDLIEKKANAFQ